MIMRAGWAILAALFGLVAAAGAGEAVCADAGKGPAKAAAPSPLLKAYKAFCYDTKAETKAALARAGAAGWRAPLLPPEGAPPGLVFRSRQVGPARLDLMVGEQDAPAGRPYSFPTRTRVCIVTASPRPIPVHKAMRALVGADPVSRQGGTWSWGYSEAGRRRDFKPPANQEEASARTSQGSMIILKARETTRDSALGFTRISKAPGN